MGIATYSKLILRWQLHGDCNVFQVNFKMAITWGLQRIPS